MSITAADAIQRVRELDAEVNELNTSRAEVMKDLRCLVSAMREYEQLGEDQRAAIDWLFSRAQQLTREPEPDLVPFKALIAESPAKGS